MPGWCRTAFHSAPLHNREFGGVDTRLFAPDASFYRDNMVELRGGKYPEEAEISLTICGIYSNPLFSISSIYEEIYASQSFREVYNPELADDSDIIYVKFNNLNPFLFHTDISSKLSELKDAVGAKSFSSGKNSATMVSAFITMLPVLLLVFLMMASGYFLIYNVFYISIASDIRWFGMMKTIEGTRAQLKKIMASQVLRMAAGISPVEAACFTPKKKSGCAWKLSCRKQSDHRF